MAYRGGKKPLNGSIEQLVARVAVNHVLNRLVGSNPIAPIVAEFAKDPWQNLCKG